MFFLRGDSLAFGAATTRSISLSSFDFASPVLYRFCLTTFMNSNEDKMRPVRVKTTALLLYIIHFDRNFHFRVASFCGVPFPQISALGCQRP
jgi:hypothetical protein